MILVKTGFGVFEFESEQAASEFARLNGGRLDRGDFPELDPDFFDSYERWTYDNPLQPEDFEHLEEEEEDC